MQYQFCNSFGTQLQVREALNEIVGFMRSEPKRRYTIIIGTDSQGLADKGADFVTAIVVHRVGNGGRYFWRRFELGKFYTLRDRIIREVLVSIETAHEILSELKRIDADGSLPHWDFEIHADVGMNGATNVLIQEVVGMIRASNFAVKTKPESYAASSVADRHT